MQKHKNGNDYYASWVSILLRWCNKRILHYARAIREHSVLLLPNRVHYHQFATNERTLAKKALFCPIANGSNLCSEGPQHL